MKTLLVAATPFEIAPVLRHLEDGSTFKSGEVEVLVTGVGLTATAFSLGHALAKHQYDLVLNAGIAGSFEETHAPGTVVQVWSETFADLGVEEQDGSTHDLFGLELLQPDTPPFREGRLWNDAAAEHQFLPPVHALSVNRVHGSKKSIQAIRNRYPYAQIESMEGAAVFYACIRSEVPFIEIRSISNMVEPRNRPAWKLDLAIGNLNRAIMEILDMPQMNE
jgi:futalosine hydrolase